MKSWSPLATMVLGAALGLGACGDDDDDAPLVAVNAGSGGSSVAGASGVGGRGGSGGALDAGGAGGAGGASAGGGQGGPGGAAGVGGAGGGQAGGQAGQGGQAPTTFRDLSGLLASEGCADCHSSGWGPTPEGNFELTYFVVRNNSTPNGCTEYPTYVDVNDVDKSFLLAKIDPSLPLPITGECGQRMPLGSDDPFEGNLKLIELMRRWITEGATF